jgi:hypothetical protein
MSYSSQFNILNMSSWRLATKHEFFGLLVIGCTLSLLLGCSKYSFIENKDGQSVFLDERGGKIIYVDASNRVIEQVDLKTKTVNQDGTGKTEAMSGKEWRMKTIPGTDFKVTFSSRFYNNKLLYQIQIEPYNNKTRSFARSISIKLTDKKGFVLETISSLYNWTNLVNDTGEDIGLNTYGSIPITLGNYLEINDWGPLWSN